MGIADQLALAYLASCAGTPYAPLAEEVLDGMTERQPLPTSEQATEMLRRWQDAGRPQELAL